MGQSSVQYSIKNDERIKNKTREEAAKYRALQDMIHVAIETRDKSFSIVETSRALGIKW